jgi:hypothetical protein
MSNCGLWLSIIPLNSRTALRRKGWDSRQKNCSLDRRVMAHRCLIPKSRRRQFVGVSSRCSSTVGLIRNLITDYVSPQFHVVYDDWFETVTADADRTPPEWEELVNHSRFLNVLDNDVDP